MDGQSPIVLAGAQGVTAIVEEGFSIWKGVIPPPHESINNSKLVLTNKSTKVEPESQDITGQADAYVRTWSYTYWAADELNEDSLNIQTLLTPKEK